MAQDFRSSAPECSLIRRKRADRKQQTSHRASLEGTWTQDIDHGEGIETQMGCRETNGYDQRDQKEHHIARHRNSAGTAPKSARAASNYGTFESLRNDGRTD
jgi:hypothetical protein